ncbi:MAG: gmhB [Chloroflexi bacterium]|nr:gmhB [Chloroflexota bacterium]
MLDRDGTLIVEKHYLSDPDALTLLPGTTTALRRMRELGLGLVLVTNQSAVARGLLEISRLAEIHDRLYYLLRKDEIAFDGVYVCPHSPGDGCPCRKPRPGLLQRAAHDLGFDVHESFMVGDKACDVEAGRQVGSTTFLVRTGYGAQTAKERTTCPHYVVDDVLSASNVITRLISADKKMVTHELAR